MTDQTSDPVQDAGLSSPPIQGVDEGVVKSGEDTAHVPITTAPEERGQTQEVQTPPVEQTSGETPASEVDQSAGGIITRPLIPDTGQQMDTPVDQSGNSSASEQPVETTTDASVDESSDLA